jgi:hypothetical protein
MKVLRKRIQPYVPRELSKRLAEHAAAAGLSESAVVEVALRQHLDGTGDRTLFLRRLDRLGRAHQRTQRDLELLSEAFAVFVKIWFAHTPTVPVDGRKAAQTSAEGRYKQFAEYVVEQFTGGRRFVDDLPREVLAEDPDLEALRTTGTAENAQAAKAP